MDVPHFDPASLDLEPLDDPSLASVRGGSIFYDAAYAVGAAAHAVWNEARQYANSGYGQTAAMWM